MRSLLHLIWVLWLCCSTTLAGTTGKVTGTVTDHDRGERLAGANVARGDTPWRIHVG